MDSGAWRVTVHGVAKESDVTEGLNNKPASCLQLYEDSEFRKWASNVRYSPPNFSLVYKNSCLVSQSCPTLQDALDCSLLGSPVRRIFQVRVLAWAVISLLQGVFPTQGWSPRLLCLLCLLCCRWILYLRSHRRSPCVQSTLYSSNFFFQLPGSFPLPNDF